jgi:Na+/proline symporter
LVTDIVRRQGVSGNWCWWAFLLTGMLTVFIYAKLWRRSALDTDLGFYEIRYSGKPAAALRGFRALYLGIFFNVMIMATVSLAAIKIGQVMFGLSPVVSLLVASCGVAVYATLGGLTGSIWADFFQYSVAMVGAFFAAYYAVVSKDIGGISSLKELFAHPAVVDKMSLFPKADNVSLLMTLFILPIAVQWWNVWYPGAEPGGGGYIAQRMLSAKDEKNAIGATLLFNFLHYAVRPWPWIVVALVSLVMFPVSSKEEMDEGKAFMVANTALVQQYEDGKLEKDSPQYTEVRQMKAQANGVGALAKAFPKVNDKFLKDDIAYPGMISKMPSGWLGLIIASLIAAYMSTIATHLNWGSSYVVQDFYVRFVNPMCEPKKAVMVGRMCMLVLLVVSGVVALLMTNAKNSFDILLQIGAGTGLIYIMRWFWWRINAYSEISAMITSFVVACFFQWGAPVFGLEAVFEKVGLFNVMDYGAWKLVLGIALTTIVWVVTTYLTKPEKDEVLINFCRKIRAGGPGWKKFASEVGREATGWDVPFGILCMMLGCVAVWSALFMVGKLLYGDYAIGAVLAVITVVSTTVLMKFVTKVKLS